MTYINDNVRGGYKCFRDEDTTRPIGFRATRNGLTITNQDNDTGAYTYTNEGDEACWGFWDKATRAIGIYGQAIPVKMVSGGLRPILNSSMAVDTSLAIRSCPGSINPIDGTAPSVGDFGMVVHAPNQDTSVPVFVPIGSGKASQYAKIAWDYKSDLDLSQGELMTYDTTNQEWITTSTLLWISAANSNSCRIDTAGNDTIFEVEAIGEATRGLVTRPLYRAVVVAQKGVTQITHLLAENAVNVLEGKLLSDDLSPDNVWDDTSSIIKTTIGTTEIENRIVASISKEWDLSVGVQDFKYTEVSDISRGINIYFRPILPLLADYATGVYESAEKDGIGQPIANYRRKLS